jgi:hypothetical protein
MERAAVPVGAWRFISRIVHLYMPKLVAVFFLKLILYRAYTFLEATARFAEISSESTDGQSKTTNWKQGHQFSATKHSNVLSDGFSVFRHQRAVKMEFIQAVMIAVHLQQKSKKGRS